jgi:2-polyprenyl-6-methoxyphenol hydroxylase-like FAD-dependent oxidoreductase
MRIGVIGGGPAGLYFALLMKARDARHEIHVREANPADATYGWGLVFAAPTLRLLADSDPAFYADLTRECAELDTMEIVHRGVHVAVKGNRWARVSRIAMLRALQQHCLARGVRLAFEARVEDVDGFAGFDLVVVADGVASSIRARHADWFEPSVERYRNKFAWYGTTALIPALSLIFRESAHGIFIAHCYQYSPTHSTFLVECDPAAWARAGLDRMSDADSRRYCEAVFRDDLAGRPLLSNRSSWFNAAIIRNRHWSRGNVVLLGDALRTVHFSIGSGTRMALQDAIALAEALHAHGDDVAAGLDEFAVRRRPGSDDFQESAVKSIRWYENVGEIFHLDPLAFAYSYFRRTGRVSHEDLRRMDPAFVAAYEAAHGLAGTG